MATLRGPNITMRPFDPKRFEAWTDDEGVHIDDVICDVVAFCKIEGKTEEEFVEFVRQVWSAVYVKERK